MKYKFKSRDIVFYTPIQEMIMNESNHIKITKDIVWDHINNHILDEINFSELISMTRCMLLREWLEKSEHNINKDIKEVINE